MTVLLAVGVRIGRDLIDHVPLHAIDDLLVILVCEILDLRECLNDAMVRDRDRRMMPLCCRLDDLFIVDKTIEQKLSPHAVIAADNVLFRGMVESDAPVPHRYRTLVVRLREYIAYVRTHYATVIYKDGDGLAVSEELEVRSEG